MHQRRANAAQGSARDSQGYAAFVEGVDDTVERHRPWCFRRFGIISLSCPAYVVEPGA